MTLTMTLEDKATCEVRKYFLAFELNSQDWISTEAEATLCDEFSGLTNCTHLRQHRHKRSQDNNARWRYTSCHSISPPRLSLAHPRWSSPPNREEMCKEFSFPLGCARKCFFELNLNSISRDKIISETNEQLRKSIILYFRRATRSQRKVQGHSIAPNLFLGEKVKASWRDKLLNRASEREKEPLSKRRFRQ